jgi:hypothetical protein
MKILMLGREMLKNWRKAWMNEMMLLGFRSEWSHGKML